MPLRSHALWLLESQYGYDLNKVRSYGGFSLSISVALYESMCAHCHTAHTAETSRLLNQNLLVERKLLVGQASLAIKPRQRAAP